MFKPEPWTLDEEKVQTPLISKPLSLLDKRDKAVSTARVISAFEENPTREFTNRSLAKELGLSEATVSCITNRLHATSTIKITEVIQRYTAYSMKYQYKEGPLPSVPKSRGVDGNKKDSVQLVHELFESDVNAVYTKKQVVEILKGQASEGHVTESIRMLLIMQVIKVLDEFEGKIPRFQHMSGNKRGLIVYYKEDPEYISFEEFFHNRFFSEKEKQSIRENFSKVCKLFYSSKSLIPKYSKTDLERYASKLQKKGIIQGGLFK